MWFVLQALTSVYLLVFTAFALTAGALARPSDWWGRRFWPVAGQALLAAGLAGLVLAPFMLPYWRAHTEQGLTRSLGDVS
jgi:MFS family permease